MQELRWILLLVGVLFLIVLASWETIRARRNSAPREPFPHLDRLPPREPPLTSTSPSQPPRGAARQSAEPRLGSLPDGLVESSDLDGAAVEPIRAQRAGPPLVELPQVSALHVGMGSGEPSELAEAEVPQVEGPKPEPSVATPAPVAASDALEPEAPTEPQAAAAEPLTQPEPPSAGAARVEWPPDGERQILSVRIASIGDQRLSGRAVRQALAACGFVHGRYHIFHQAAEDGRVLLSCASLNKPGNFDPASMDFQRYSGLSIFAVLPGPLPAPAALERLLETGRDLSHRLQARLLDERGEPLDATRIAALRAVGGEPGT